MNVRYWRRFHTIACRRPNELLAVPGRQSIEDRIGLGLYTLKQRPCSGLEASDPLVGDFFVYIAKVNVHFSRVEMDDLPQPANRVLHMDAKFEGVGHG